MICRYISQYLKNHKRLTVPHLGTFLFNAESNEILFFDLLKNDDGVLRQLLVNDGYTQIDAAGAIDRFVFEVRHRVESGGTYTLEGIGRMSRGFDGLYRFEYDPNAGRKIAVPAEDVARKTPEPAAGETAESRKVPQDTVREPADEGHAPAAPTPAPSNDAAEISNAADNRGAGQAVPEQKNGPDKTAHAATAPRQTASTSQPQNTPGTEDAAGAQNNAATNRTADATPNTEPRQPESPRTVNDAIGKQRSIIEPEAYVKGLRYGKPARPSKDDLRYVGHNQRRHVDKFIIIAIVAAILAVAAILYGYFNNRAMSDEWIYDNPVETVQPDMPQPAQIQTNAE